MQIKADAILTESAQLREKLTHAITEDSAAFDRLMAAFRHKELDEENKAKAIESATIGAGEVPLRVALLSRDVAILAQKIAEIGNVNAVSDAAAAAYMAQAAVLAAGMNVRINGASLANQELAKAWAGEVDALVNETSQIVEQVTAIARERGGF